MFWQSLKYLIFLGLIVPSLSCTRLPEVTVEGTPGTLPVESLPDSLTVPAEWGDLVGVTGSASLGTVLLWFQDEEATIRRVRYNNELQLILPFVATVIRRR